VGLVPPGAPPPGEAQAPAARRRGRPAKKTRAGQIKTNWTAVIQSVDEEGDDFKEAFARKFRPEHDQVEHRLRFWRNRNFQDQQ